MSHYVSTWAWRLKGLTPTEKLVLVCLADQASDQGVCWPGVGNIQERTGLSERSIRGVLAKLRKMGVLDWKSSQGHSNIYQLPYEVVHTPARSAPLKKGVPLHHVHPPMNVVHPTPAPGAPPPLHHVHPESLFESAVESSKNHARAKRNGKSTSSSRADEERKAALNELIKQNPNWILSPMRMRTIAEFFGIKRESGEDDLMFGRRICKNIDQVLGPSK